jgi:hypothetical protein
MKYLLKANSEMESWLAICKGSEKGMMHMQWLLIGTKMRVTKNVPELHSGDGYLTCGYSKQHRI